jgi:hypothetical protein
MKAVSAAKGERYEPGAGPSFDKPVTPYDAHQIP